ncbi:MAG: cell division protein ZipA C-terminal FtsZ-binding domain-containing protein, partial [Betaproteobacteria bacterium]
MSTLQIGLLIIGAILVIAVYGYNLVQERRIRRRMDEAFKTTADTPLDPAPSPGPNARTRVEPTLAAVGDATDVAVAPVTPEAMPEPPPLPEAPFENDRGSAPLANEPASGTLPDPDIECVARLQAVQPLPGVLLMDAVSAAYAKPCRWVGREIAGGWGGLRDGDSYSEVAACLVLADRTGPLSESGYAHFRATIEQLGRALPAAFIIGERAEELERAKALDLFCADVDIQIGLNLLRRDGGRWTGTRLRGVAEASGFKLNGGGQFDYMSDDSGLQYRLQNREEQPFLADSMKLLATSGITLLLDVPRVPEPVKAYDNMRALAKRLAVTLDGELVDDNGKPLTDAGLGTIRSQLQTVQAT